MRKLMVFAFTAIVSLMLSIPVFAVPPGKNVEYAGGGAGKVIFSGDVHKVNKCNECHTAVFKMKKGSVKMTMEEMNQGKYCGHCHNGTKAFSTKDEANCGKCHKK